MKFSIGVKDITPTGPAFQAGFGSRERKSEGVLQPIYLKAVLLQANKPVLIVAFDAMGADRGFVVGIKDALRDRFGLAHEDVLLNFSHAHSSFYFTGLDASLRGGLWSIGQDRCPADHFEGAFAEDEAYFVEVRDALLATVAGCFENLTDGTLGVASVDSDFSVSRRLPLGDGKTAFVPNEAAEIDRELTVFTLTDGGGRLRGIVYCHGSHPTTLGDTYVIANDFVSYTSEALEERYPEAVAVFLQACGAELKPRATVHGDSFGPCSVAEVQAMGRQLASEVGAVIDAGEFQEMPCEFRTALSSCNLLASPQAISFYREILDDPNCDYFQRTCATRMLLARADGTARRSIPCYVAAWQLAPGTHLVAIEGEVSTEYSLAIKRYFGQKRMTVLGYSNGVQCYVPTRKMIGEGGYEAECNYFFSLQGHFEPEIEDTLIGQTARLLHQVR